MNITIAIVFVKGVATARVESDCLVECSVEGNGNGERLDVCRQRLTEAFSDIYDTSDIDILFPELGECVE